VVASKAGKEKAGSKNFTERQSELFGQGFSFSGYERDMLQLNMGDKTFQNISGTSGIDSVTDGRGSIFADFDNDGDTDVFLTTIQGQSRLLFRNNLGNSNGFIRVTLLGTKSGPDAFGAEVRLKTKAGLRTRLKSGGGGYNSQSDPRLLFGLGKEARADWLQVTWPSGAVQRFENVDRGSSILITEGEATFKQIQERRFNLPDPISAEEAQLLTLHLKRKATLPDLKLFKADGTAQQSKGLLEEGKVHLLNVWATWCVPCAREMPELQGLQAAHGDKLKVIGLSLDPEKVADQVRLTLKKRSIRYPNFRLDDAAVKSIYASADIFVPLSILLDDKGKVLDMFPGWNAKARERVLALIKER